jgi:hypothetical protein
MKTYSFTWGRRRENRVWIAPKSRNRILFRDHDALYVECGRFRLRIMKPQLHARGMEKKSTTCDI